MNCIIIDDEQTSREILYKFCSTARNITVKRMFNNAIQGIDYLKYNKIDVVLLDIHMPELSGFDFLDKIKSPPKVILTTSDRDLAAKAFQYRCVVDYIGKPYKFARFIKAIDKVHKIVKYNSVE